MYKWEPGSFRILPLGERAFLGNISKHSHFTLAATPYLIAVTARSRRVFHVKQVSQMTLFPTPTLQFTEIMVFLGEYYSIRMIHHKVPVNNPWSLQIFSEAWLKTAMTIPHLNTHRGHV